MRLGQPLEGRRGARRGLGKNGPTGGHRVLRERQRSDRLQRGHGRGDNKLRQGLMTEMAVGTARIVVQALVIPITDDARGKDQQDDKRQGNLEYSNGLLHDVFGPILI
jgi:hypothetical protein